MEPKRSARRRSPRSLRFSGLVASEERGGTSAGQQNYREQLINFKRGCV